RKMGQEGALTAEVALQGVRVPGSALVGGDVDAGYRAAMTSLARGRTHIAAVAVGAAQRAHDESVAHAAATEQGGTPIGGFQLVQAMLADQYAGVAAGRALVRETAAAYDSGEDRRIAPSAPSCTAPRWRATSRTWPCRSTAAAATCAGSRSSGSTATSDSSGCTRGPARSNA